MSKKSVAQYLTIVCVILTVALGALSIKNLLAVNHFVSLTINPPFDTICNGLVGPCFATTPVTINWATFVSFIGLIIVTAILINYAKAVRSKSKN